MTNVTLAVTALATVLALTAAPAAAQPPADPAAAAPAPDQAVDKPVNDRAVDASQPDFTLIALPTTLRIPRFGSSFRVTHRFTRPLGQGDFGDLLSDGLGIDSGAQIGLEYRFGIFAGTQVGVHRTSDRTIQFFVQQNVLRQIENLRTYPAVRDGEREGRIRLAAWWFDIARAEVLDYDAASQRFVPLDEARIARLLAERETPRDGKPLR